MFNGLVGYAGEVADGAQAAWDHAEENDARYKSGDVEGGVEADLAFLGGLAQRSHNAGCGGRLAAVLSAGWLRDLDPRAFDRGYRAAPFGDLVIDTGVMAVAPAVLEEGLAASAERSAMQRLAAAEAEALAPRAGVLRDPKSVAEFTLAERLDLQIKHQALISRLRRGDVEMPSGWMSAQLMGDLTVATGQEVALIRIGNQRLLRLGGADSAYVGDATRLIAHTHPSGVLRFSTGAESDMTVFTDILTRQRSSVLVAPDGTAVRLPIPRP
jgi:hypothetical protein